MTPDDLGQFAWLAIGLAWLGYAAIVWRERKASK